MGFSKEVLEILSKRGDSACFYYDGEDVKASQLQLNKEKTELTAKVNGKTRKFDVSKIQSVRPSH